MTKKNNKTFLQTLMSLFKTQTKKVSHRHVKGKQTKRAKSSMKGGMLRAGTVVRNMPKHS